MPRTGKHPLKLDKSQQAQQTFQRVSICTVTHIPMLDGYWAESLEVLKRFFTSINASTALPFDLLVFDNASCPEVQDYLLEQQRAGKIQFLHFSRYNLKKLGGMDALFSVAPGEFVAFADSDVYFLPGWLEDSLQILETFPECGQVSALPTIDKAREYVSSTLSGIASDPSLQVARGALVPQEYIEAHRTSIGRTQEDYLANAGPRQDILITRNGISAYVSAQDFQFLTRRAVIEQVLPLEVRHPGEYYDPIYSPVFEAKTDEHGWWRLSTRRYLIHHMGNTVPDLSTELGGIIETGQTKSVVVPLRPLRLDWRARLLHSRPVRGLLKRLYAWTYRLLFEKA